MSFLDRVDLALSGTDSLAEVLRLTIEQFSAETGTIHLMEADGVLHLKAASGNLPAVVLDRVRLVPVGKGMAGLAVERGEPVTACNIQTDASGDVQGGAKLTGMEGAIVAPVLRGDTAVGALGIANRRERTFTAEETALLIEVGRRIARATP